MEYVLICLATLLVSMVTLLSGFGLSTVLVPVFALFFPLPLAIASVALVHLFNNLFQAGLVGKFAKPNVVLKFGVPAALAAIVGALLLTYFTHISPLVTYHFGGVEFNITTMRLIVGIVVIASSLFDLVRSLSHFSVPPRYLPLGGALSGFFGGLSGNQGILRAAFLIKAGLTKEQFIGTSVVCSILVDIARISVYGLSAYKGLWGNLEMTGILVAATATAFLGSYLGSKWMGKITLKSVRRLVGWMLLVLGFVIALGLGKNI